MKKRINTNLVIAAAVSVCIYSCKKTNTTPSSPTYNISQTNLVADAASFNPAQVDANLVNAWGLAANPTGIIWASSNKKSLSTVYDSTGHTVMAPVGIPSSGAPTGMVFNGSATEFGGNTFIFADESGKITAWTNGTTATAVGVNNLAGYTGLTIGNGVGADFLLAANFKEGKVDIYDNSFNYVPVNPFVDTTMAAGFSPFNVQNIGGMIYVTYAKHSAGSSITDAPAPGNGYVNIFKPDGTFVKRFASNGTLNSPWGITLAPAGFAAVGQTILVGNFGDGRINIFDLNGNHIGQLQKDGSPVVIDGLWALSFLKATPSATSKLYFTAGPGGEAHGILGYLQSNFTATTGSTGGSTNPPVYPGY